MAQESPAALPPSNEKGRKRRKKQPKGDQGAEGVHRSLAWRSSPLDEDPFALLADGDEGGFLSLEEIDESEYGLVGGMPDPPRGRKVPSSSAKSKKRKHGSGGDGGAGSYDEDSVVEDGGEAKKVGKKKAKKKKRPKAKKEKEKEESDGVSVAETLEGASTMDSSLVSADGSEIIDIEDQDNGQSIFQNDEYRAWKKLKLHSTLMKSIRRLGFKEPTPIQKTCIPAAVHEGKDVIGAAETGSGKTLAFGLPVMHRLLKECDKASKLLKEGQDDVEEGTHGSPLRALILAPTRELAMQVSDHLKEIAKLTNIGVVPIVGGMSAEKQERLLKKRPEIIVGTPGRLWELMSAGERHLVELNSLSFFVLDEADRMIESGHFNELQSIIDMLPSNRGFVKPCPNVIKSCNEVPCSLQKTRQTFVFSATIALSNNFRKKLKRGFLKAKSASSDGLSSIERLSERAGMRADVAIVDLTNASIVADKLEESFIECNEENKDAYLYYILSVHGHGRTIVFCTSITALRRISSILRLLDIKVWTLHAQMQQRARLKAIDRFRDDEDGVLIATDVAARGLDIPGVRTVIHYQLPHSAEVYIHRSGRTARASADGCCIALISAIDRAKFFSLCKSLSKESLMQFPVVDSYMPEVMKRLSLARQIDKILRKSSQENVTKNWFERNAESMELIAEESGSEEERVQSNKQKKISSLHLKKLQEELNSHLAKPLQPRTLSRRFLAGAGLSLLLQRQLEELSKHKQAETMGSRDNKRSRFVVVGQDCVEPLQALRSSGREICVNADKGKETRRLAEQWKTKRRRDKKHEREQRRKEKRKLKKVN